MNNVTLAVQSPNMSVHSNNEPSCEPQVAAKRYATGNCECELVATFSTVKSFVTNDTAREQKAMTRNKNCARAARVPTAIQDGLPRAAPIIGTVACVSAINSASIDAKCPTSGII